MGAQDLKLVVAKLEIATPGSFLESAGREIVRRQNTVIAGREAVSRGVALKDHPPFIVVHTGGQDHLSLCATSLALKNGANNVILIGDSATESIGVGRFARMSEYIKSAESFAKRYVHHSVTPPIYELFCFQRWLIVEEYCRANKLDQFIMIDSDALAFSSASDIFAAMPAGFKMNDWAWTCTIRDRQALGQMTHEMQELYNQPLPDIVSKVDSLGRVVIGQDARSFQDMHFLYHFRDSHPTMVCNQFGLEYHGGLDQAINVANRMETESSGAICDLLLGREVKKPYMRDAKLHFKDDETGHFARFHTVHCQGPAKQDMHRYAALLLTS